MVTRYSSVDRASQIINLNHIFSAKWGILYKATNFTSIKIRKIKSPHLLRLDFPSLASIASKRTQGHRLCDYSNFVSSSSFIKSPSFIESWDKKEGGSLIQRLSKVTNSLLLGIHGLWKMPLYLITNDYSLMGKGVDKSRWLFFLYASQRRQYCAIYVSNICILKKK